MMREPAGGEKCLRSPLDFAPEYNKSLTQPHDFEKMID